MPHGSSQDRHESPQLADTTARLALAALALDAAGLGSWELDLGTRALISSPQCKANHGLPAHADLYLTQVVDAIRPDAREHFSDALAQAIRTSSAFAADVPVRWDDGSEHWLRVRGRVLDADRMVGISQDITAEHAAEQALRDADHRKDEFLAVVMHELRGPLAAILNAVRVLELYGPPVPRLQEARRVIVRQTQHLNKLVEDLLDVGRIAAGKLALRLHRVELNGLLQQAAETCGPLIEGRAHTLELGLTLAPLYVHVDAGRIIQVLCNLLSNAAKYMRDGGHIVMTAASDGGHATIAVRDQGVGIPPHMLERVFERYVQVRSSEYRASGGLGIGLSIARVLIEMHGGTITAHSEGIGKGAEFVVRLPLAPARAPGVKHAERRRAPR